MLTLFSQTIAFLFTICAGTHFAEGSQVTAAFENRVYFPHSPLEDGHSEAVSLYSGGLTDWNVAPTDGLLGLVQWSAGTWNVEASDLRHGFYCGELRQFHSWLFGFFSADLLASPNAASRVWGVSADPDGDGRNNFMEYATGGNPLEAEGVAPIGVSFIELMGTNYLEVFVTQRASDPDLSFDLELSEDLKNWEPSASRLQSIYVITLPGGLVQKTYRDTQPLSPNGKQFVKLVVVDHSITFPQIELFLPETGSTIIVSNSTLLTANLSGDTACAIQVEFWVNGVYVGRATDGNLSVPWTPTQTNLYNIVARIIDNNGLEAVSSLRQVRVDYDADGDQIPDSKDSRPLNPNTPPIIQSFQITSMANFHTAGAVQVLSPAMDLDGDFISRQLLLDSLTVQSPTPANPFTWQPSLSQAGLHSLRLQVRDSWGAMTEASKDVYLFQTPPTP